MAKTLADQYNEILAKCKSLRNALSPAELADVTACNWGRMTEIGAQLRQALDNKLLISQAIGRGEQTPVILDNAPPAPRKPAPPPSFVVGVTPPFEVVEVGHNLTHKFGGMFRVVGKHEDHLTVKALDSDEPMEVTRNDLLSFKAAAPDKRPAAPATPAPAQADKTPAAPATPSAPGELTKAQQNAAKARAAKLAKAQAGKPADATDTSDADDDDDADEDGPENDA